MEGKSHVLNKSFGTWSENKFHDLATVCLLGSSGQKPQSGLMT
jgi:hypothetical protein